jgi:glycosyltransferase involved in cell wall biosynthesis
VTTLPSFPLIPDLSASDIQLHALVDYLFLHGALDHKAYHNRVLGLLASTDIYETQHSAEKWAHHLSNRGMGFDARLQMAMVLAKLTGLAEIPRVLLRIELKKAVELQNITQLREIHASTTAIVLRPALKTFFGTPREQISLIQAARSACSALQTWTAAQPRPQRAQNDTPKSGRAFLLMLSWIPANAETGAHLKQLASYSRALALAAKARNEGPVRIRVIFTYENITFWLAQNFQSYSKPGAKVIEDTVLEALEGLDVAFDILHLLPPHYDTTAAWLQATVDAVDDFNPDSVIRWYGFYASNFTASVIQQKYPMLGIQFNANNAIDKFAHILLNQGDLKESHKSDPRWRNHLIPVEVLPRRLTFTRADCELPEKSFVIASTLSGKRLEKSITMLTPERLAELLSVFERHPNLKWLWIGVHDVELLRAHDPELCRLIDTDRIRCIEFSDDLRALYEHCDLYVHLPAMFGGGMGVAMAIVEHRAVLAHAGTDPCNFLAPDTVVEGWDLFMQTLDRLITSPDERAQITQEQETWLAEKHSLAAVGQELLDYIAQARGIFEVSQDRQGTDLSQPHQSIDDLKNTQG